MTLVWMIVFGFGCHRNSSTWAAVVSPRRRIITQHCRGRVLLIRFLICVCVCAQDFAYHGLAAFFYLSAAVMLAYVTLSLQILPQTQIYKTYVSAVVRTHLRVNEKITEQTLRLLLRFNQREYFQPKKVPLKV